MRPFISKGRVSLAVLVVLVGLTARAAPVGARVGVLHDVTMAFGRINPTTHVAETWDQAVITPDSVSGDFSGSDNFSNGDADVSWTLWGNVDPVVHGVFGVANNTLATQTYFMSAVLTLGAPVVPSSMTSGVMNVTLVDFSGDGATMAAPPGGAMYKALIDGVLFRNLLVGTSLGALPFDANDANESFGLPGQTEAGPAAWTSIAVEYRFSLTAMSQGTANGNLVLIPEPASLALLVVGLSAISARRR